MINDNDEIQLKHNKMNHDKIKLDCTMNKNLPFFQKYLLGWENTI